MNLIRKLGLGASTVALLAVVPAYAQDESGEELRQNTVTVTGSFIAGTPEDAALPVDVIGAADLQDIGSPTVNEILRNLPATQGLIGETNQCDTRGGQGNEGATTINLRGLGSARTLVLVNGKRHVSTSVIGTDVNFIPAAAIGSIEVLKDGAAALYGSDAIGGVVNFRTRSDFEGFELRASQQFIQDSDGDIEIGGIWGHAGDKFNLIIAGEYGYRDELQVKDRDWALLDYADNPQGGWSSVGNPGTLINPGFIPIAAGAGVPPVVFGQVDPNCNVLGGFNTPIASTGGGICRFQYTYFDNLIEETEQYKLMGELNYEINANTNLNVQAAWSKLEIPEWNTSPSYPPQSLINTRVDADHPGLVDLFAQNPGYEASLGPFPTDNYAFWGRFAGVGGIIGEPGKGVRETDQTRITAQLDGSLFDNNVSYDISVGWSQRERYSQGEDMFVERFAFALDGLGGPGCDPATGTPGVGSCEYFNPFSNAIQTSAVTGAANPQYNPAVANSDAMINWLTGELETFTTDELLTFDAVFSGQTNWELAGGTVGWAVGAQSRNEKYNLELSDSANLAINPCPFNNPASITNGNATAVGPDSCDSPTGLFGFLSGTVEQDLERTIYGVFGELALPVSDNFDVQLALRFEDYGGNVGSTVDPKIAAKWQVNDMWAVRGSASTTFRGPPLPFLQGQTTSLAFVGPTNAFKAIDTIGNPDLEPETALATNLGILFENGPMRASIDYWRFDFSDPLQLESQNQLVGSYGALGCADGGAGVGTPECDALRERIFPTGIAAAGLERVERQWINGSDIVTSGLDYAASYAFDLDDWMLTVGVDGTYTSEYDSDDFLTGDGLKIADGGDFVGFLNEGTPFQSIVEQRINAYGKYERGPHTLTYNARYVSGYTDVAPSIPALGEIDSHLTYDLTYNLNLNDGNTSLSLSAYNITDEDPPAASTDLSYDPYQHNAFGRMIKVGIVQKF